MTRPLPVTVLSGFPGAGKTTLLKQLLASSPEQRIAVLQNPVRPLGRGPAGLKPGVTQLRLAPGHLRELGTGCACCTGKEDFVAEVSRCARSQRFEHLLVEASGTAEPLPLAMAFDWEDPEGELLGSVAHIDSLITVVDAFHFLRDFVASGDLAEAGLALSPGDDRGIPDLLAEQVEFANVLVVNKCDLVGADELAELIDFLRCLNPEAQIHTCLYGHLPAERLLGTGLYDQTNTGTSAFPASHAAEDGQASAHQTFVYRSRLPFHPERLHDFFLDTHPGLLRSKGLFWLASRMNESGLWSLAGRKSSHQGAGRFWASVDRDHWPEDEELHATILADFEEPYGDRRQELVFIGKGLDQAALTARLDACLLDSSELAMGPLGWSQLRDPFAPWGQEEQDDTGLSLPASARPFPSA